MEWLAGLPWGWMALVGVLVLWGYADAVADSQKVAERVREKLHRERLKAIEKGLPPPDSGFDEALLLYLADGTPGTDAGAARARNRTLGWAIVLVSAGIGWFLTCLLMRDQGPFAWLYYARMFGIIPVTLGAGLLLQLRLTRTHF